MLRNSGFYAIFMQKFLKKILDKIKTIDYNNFRFLKGGL